MSEFSKNLDTEPMSRRRRRQVQSTRTILRHLMDQNPAPDTPPDRIPGVVGSVVIQPSYGFGYTENAQPGTFSDFHATVSHLTQRIELPPEPPTAA